SKRRKIMLTHQMLGSFMHQLRVQRAIIPGHLLTKERRWNGAIVNHVTVATRKGAVAGMQTVWHLTHSMHDNIVFQEGVGAHDPTATGTCHASVKMNHLVGGMDACIGTSGAHQADFFISHAGQCGFQRLLHAAYAISLGLETMKTGTVILNNECHASITNAVFRG